MLKHVDRFAPFRVFCFALKCEGEIGVQRDTVVVIYHESRSEFGIDDISIGFLLGTNERIDDVPAVTQARVGRMRWLYNARQLERLIQHVGVDGIGNSADRLYE